jgi:hypothetical protein
MVPLKCEIHNFIDCVVIFYNRENGPVKCVISDLSTSPQVFSCSEETSTVKA